MDYCSIQLAERPQIKHLSAHIKNPLASLENKVYKALRQVEPLGVALMAK